MKLVPTELQKLGMYGVRPRGFANAEFVNSETNFAKANVRHTTAVFWRSRCSLAHTVRVAIPVIS
jgi:hypothetical protein